MRTFVDIKSITGCRLNDLCQVESWQFDGKKKTLFITAEQDKTNQERLLHLTDDLVAEVAKCNGPRYLWEQYVLDTAVYRPGFRRATDFQPSLMYHALQSIFSDYNETHSDKKLKTHDFRRRAVTLMAKAYGGDMDDVAEALNITVETARRHYLDAKKVRDKEAIRKTMPELLLVKRVAGDEGEKDSIAKRVDSGTILGR